MKKKAGHAASSQDDPREDRELVARAQKGELEAFDQLVTKYRGKVYGMIYNLVHNEQEAWDLAQDGFIKAWKAMPKFKGQSSFYTWLYRIVHNVTYDWLRKKKIQAVAEFDDAMETQIETSSPTVPRPVARPDKAVQSGELRAEIERALGQLSPEHREVVLLKDVEGFRYHEISEILDISKGTVMSRLFYARKKLQELLKQVYETIG